MRNVIAVNSPAANGQRGIARELDGTAQAGNLPASFSLPSWCLVLVAFGWISSDPIVSRAASLVPIGHLPGGSVSEANAISADGRVVVGRAVSPGFPDGQAFRWTQAGGMVGLGDLPGAGTHSSAHAVSADGLVVVGYGLFPNTLNGAEAFRWTAASGMVRLTEILPPQTINTDAYAVSANGEFVAGLIDTPSGREAFRWSAATGLVGLGDLEGGSFASTATGISADGSVVVGEGRSAEGDEAFRWTAASGMVGLGFLLAGADQRSVATDVSADGDLVVGFNTSAAGSQAFRWTASGGMVGLGIPPGGGSESLAFGVSADGSTVAGHAFGDEGPLVFIWTSSRGMRSLWDVLVSLGVNPAADGWSSLSHGAALSADGRFVTGWGQRNGTDEGFVADLATRLDVTLVAGGFELTWPVGLKLLRAAAINAPIWDEILGAAPPFKVVPGTGNGFFRVAD